MTIITVNAERSYEVTLTNSWRKDLVSICEARTRVAVIVSETYSPELTELIFLPTLCPPKMDTKFSFY